MPDDLQTWAELHAPTLHRAITAGIRDAIAEEREACAKLAEQTGRLNPLFADQELQKGIAAAIRARGQP